MSTHQGLPNNLAVMLSWHCYSCPAWIMNPAHCAWQAPTDQCAAAEVFPTQASGHAQGHHVSIAPLWGWLRGRASRKSRCGG